MKKMKLNIQLFAGSVSIGTITETTDINTNQSTFSIPATMTTSGQTFNNDDAYMTLQWRYSGGSWTTISKKTFGISTNSSKTKSWSLTLTHEDDGTLPDIQFRVKWYITSSTNGTTGAKTYSPTTIPRASEIDSATSGTTRYYPTIIWTPKSYTFMYRLTYKYGDTIIAKTDYISPHQTTPYTFNEIPIPSNVFRNVNSQTMTITAILETFQVDFSLVGQATKTFTVTLNSDVKPTINIRNVREADSTMQNLNWRDANNNFIYIQNHSKLLIYYSTNYNELQAPSVATTINANSQTFNSQGYVSSTFETNALTTSGSKTINATATDSRGRSATTSTTYNVVAYSNPTIITAQVERCDANGNVSKDGLYCKISYGASISSCLGKNTPYAVYKVGYRIQDTGDYTYITLGTNADSKSLSGVLFTDGIKSASSSGTKVEFDTDYTWDIQFYVEDAFTEYTNKQSLDTGFDLLNFNASGKAMAIGKVSEAGANEELLEVALLTKHYDQIILNTPTDIYAGMSINSSNRDEATIQYTKRSDTSKSWVAGYGPAGFDGFAIYSHETGQNVFDVNKNGDIYAPGSINVSNYGLNGNYGLTGIFNNLLGNQSYESDLNNALTTGFYNYYIETENRPSTNITGFADWGLLIVIRTDTWYYQIAVGNYGNPRIAIRSKIGGNWTQWDLA